jgi:acyl carrier protein phosphodiesterase
VGIKSIFLSLTVAMGVANTPAVATDLVAQEVFDWRGNKQAQKPHPHEIPKIFNQEGLDIREALKNVPLQNYSANVNEQIQGVRVKDWVEMLEGGIHQLSKEAIIYFYHNGIKVPAHQWPRRSEDIAFIKQSLKKKDNKTSEKNQTVQMIGIDLLFDIVCNREWEKLDQAEEIRSWATLPHS